jgi:hypothetical protein
MSLTGSEQNENGRLLFRNYSQLQDNARKALYQAQRPPELQALCDYTGHRP